MAKVPTKYEKMLDEQAEAEGDLEAAVANEEAEKAEEDAAEAGALDEPAPFTGVDEEALAEESARHVTAMQGILGPLFPDASPCPVCDGSGVTPESIEKLPELEPDPYAEACPTCKGAGMFKLPSRREGQTERSCTDCNGNGWRTKQLQAAPPPAPVPVFMPPPPPNGEPLPAHLPPGTLDQLRAAGFVVVPPPPGGQSIAP